MAFSLAHAVSRQRRKSRLDAGETRFRIDIEGLRALAVVLVIADHLFGWPRGGFVGVDVFFVISGFLITGILLKDLEANNRIDFRKFYVRRVRRIIPIAILVLAATTAASWAIFVPARAVQTTVDAGYSAVFFANWHYAFTGSDYFAISSEGSPLLHYWSLSVEEQYYLVWPSVLMLLALLGHRAFRNRLIVGLAGAAIVVSFTWAMVQGNSEPAIAYYSTFTRAWELGIGALLAVSSSALARTIPLSLRPTLAWGGLALICASAALLSTTSGFPGPWAALPVLGTATVILAGTGGRTGPPIVLTNPVSAYIGKISYSLYLWHYPIIIILAAVLPRTLSYFVVCLALMAMVSIVSFHSFEDPIRRSHWLDSKKVVRPHRRRSTSSNAMPTTVLLGLFTLLTGGIVAMAMQVDAPETGPLQPRTSAFGPATSTSQSSSAAKTGVLLESALTLARQRDVQAALASSQWPKIDVSAAALNWNSATREAHCSSSTGDVPQCIFANPRASKKVVVVGDSTSLAWLPAIRGALEPQGWQVTVLYHASCPWVPVKLIDEKGSPNRSCDTFHERFPAVVAKMAPDMVIAAHWFTYYGSLSSRAAFPAALNEWRDSSEVMIRSLAKSSPRVVILATPPGGPNIAKCMTRFNSPTDCESPLPPAWQPMSDATEEAVRSTASSVVDVKYVDTLSWFCAADGRCPAFIGKSPVTADGEHLSPGQAASLKNLMAEALGK